VSTYEAAYGVRYGNPVFSLLCGFVVLYGAVIASAVILRGKSLNKIWGMGFIVLIFSWGIYTSDKNVILIGLLAVAAVYSSLIKKQGLTFLMVVFIGCAILIYLIKVFSFYRGGLDICSAFSMAVNNFGLRYIDPLGPLVSLQHILNDCSDLQYGQTYLHIFYLIIPRFLWKERPLDLSEQFAVDNIVNWLPGQGMGYSPLAEAYLNFSWIGPVIQYLLLGLLWGYFWKVLRKILWNFSQGLWYSLYYVLGYYLLILMHRGPVAGLMKSLILYTVPLILLVIFIDLGIFHPDFLMKVSRSGSENGVSQET
jgi:oligosaccharide repeat unit polymerase